jgi:hypothetical protein
MKKVIRLTESDLTRIVKRVIKENEDFTKEIAKDLFKRLPKNELTMGDFLTYMKEKGAPDSISREVLRHLEMMDFPFKMEKQREPEFTYDNDDSEEYEMLSDDPSDWYFDIYLTKYPGDYWDRTLVTLNIDPDYVDTEVGVHNVPSNILEILNECGFDPYDTEDGHWYLKSGFGDLTKQELIDCLTSKGLNHTDLDM